MWTTDVPLLSSTSLVTVGLALVVGGLVTSLWLGVDRREADVAVNAAAALAATASPLVVEYGIASLVDTSVDFGPILPLCIAVAGFLHMLGMHGWYDTVWWWDHVTHTVSAALVAALVYAWVVVAGADVLPGPLGRSVGAATIGLTLAAGVAWEVLEHAARVASDRAGIERVLEHYGRFDTPLDLLFDGIGAIAIVALDGRIFTPLFEPIPGLSRTLLSWFVVAIGAIAAASAVVVVAGREG